MSIVTDTLIFGQAVRQERKRQRLTQAELAALAGVGPRFVRELEAGKPGCQIGLAFQLLTTLGIRVTLSSRSDPAA